MRRSPVAPAGKARRAKAEKSEWFRRRCHGLHFGNQLACSFELGFVFAVTQKPVRADAHEPFRRHVHQKAPQELHSVESDQFLSLRRALKLPTKGVSPT